jgi:thymidylate synthase
MINKFQESPTPRQEIAFTWIFPLDTKVVEVPFMTLENFEIRNASAHRTIFPEGII